METKTLEEQVLDHALVSAEPLKPVRYEPWHALSGSGQKAYLARQNPPISLEEITLAPLAQPVPQLGLNTPAAPGVPVNIRVNDPGEDAGFGNNTTQSEPSLAVSANYVVAGYNDSTPVSSFSGWANSANAGQTFTDEGGLPNPASGDNVMTANAAGDFYFATLDVSAAGLSIVSVARSTDHGATFGAPVNATGAVAGANIFEDKEWITVDNTGGPHAGTLYLVWTHFTNNFANAQIMLTRSTNNGATWSAPIGISSNGTGFGHQGAMPVVAPNGDVYVVWLDRANSQILVRRSTDGGVTFNNPVPGGGAVQAITQIPGLLNGNIRANSFISIAANPNTGAIYIVYAAQNGADQADIFLTRSANNGQTWSAPLRVNDDATANHQWMPSVAVASNGVIGVMFYDRRNDPANLNIDIYLALSTDGGATFLPNKRISTTAFPPAVNFDPRIAANYMGDYNQMVSQGTRFYMVWGDNRDLVGARHDPNVYFATYGTEDCYVRDNPADDGTVPSTAGQAWQSPDIQPDMNPAVFGTIDPVHIVVHNMGVNAAQNVTVHFFWADPATSIPAAAWHSDRITVETAPGVFTPTNQQVIAAVPPGGSVEPPQPFRWDPPDPSTAGWDRGHFCLIAQIESAGDPITFSGGGWEAVERDNNLAVRNVHVDDMAGNEPIHTGFYIVGDLKRKWIADLVVDPRGVPAGVKMQLTLPAAILKRAKFDHLKVVKRTEKQITVSITPGRVARITGMELAAKGRYKTNLLLAAPARVRLQDAPLRFTQVVDGATVGGILHLLRRK